MLAVFAGCGSDEVEIPDDLRGEPTCMWIAGPRVYFEDGTSSVILHPKTQLSPAACRCMTREDFEAGGWEDDLHEQALEICEDVAAMYDQEWNDCQEYFDSGIWFLHVFWNSQELDPPPTYDPGCIGE